MINEAEKFSAALQMVYRETRVEQLPTSVIRAISTLIRADAIGFNVVHADSRVEVVHNAPYLAETIAQRVWALGTYLHQHPLEKCFKETGTSEPIRISDFLTRRQFQQLDIYQEFFRHTHTEYQLTIYLPQEQDFRIALNFNNQRQDFTNEDKMVLRHMAPHVLQAYNNAREISRLRAQAQRLERASTVHRQGFIHLSRSGQVTNMTPLCRQWLAEYFYDFRPSAQGLPESLRDWVKHQTSEHLGVNVKRQALFLPKPGNRLAVRLVEDGEGFVLLFSEQNTSHSSADLASLGLGRRETEVLYWMAQGKTNSEIAVIQGISLRTVQKHNENIFRKLGVETRHAATLLALEILS